MSRKVVLVILTALVVSFQNCSPAKFSASEQFNSKNHIAGDGDDNTTDDPPNLEVCEGVSCVLDPITKKPAVVTILLALGDEVGGQLVANGASTQLIAETTIRYVSPKTNPRILVVKDKNNNGESAYDTIYISDVLLARYDADSIDEPSNGLSASDLAGYDVVWFNNPGWPMGNVNSRDALLAFAGGVVISGDDLSHGNGFDPSELTGLRYIDNGTSTICNGVQYHMDNNVGEKFRVTLDQNKLPGANMSELNFSYGNDIDLTAVLRPDLEVLATARVDVAGCTEDRPVIVRYQK